MVVQETDERPDPPLLRPPCRVHRENKVASQVRHLSCFDGIHPDYPAAFDDGLSPLIVGFFPSRQLILELCHDLLTGPES